MHHSRPGEMRSFTLSMFASLILSPTATSARAGGASIVAVTASAAASLRVVVIGRPSLDDPRPCLGSESEASVSRSVDRAKVVPRPATAGGAITEALGQSVGGRSDTSFPAVPSRYVTSDSAAVACSCPALGLYAWWTGQ